METETIAAVEPEVIEAPAQPRRGRPPGTKPEPKDFFARLQDLNWEACLIYLYRREPMVDRITAGEQAKYIGKYAEPIDEDRVMQDHGSGAYTVKVVEAKSGAKQGKTEQIDQHRFEILNPAYPPKIPVGDWLDDHRNRRWQWAKDLLQPPKPAEAQPVANQQQPYDAASTIRAVKEVAQVFMPQQNNGSQPNSDLYKTAMENITSAYKENKPMGAAEIIGLITPLLQLTQQPKSDSSGIERILQLQLDAANKSAEAAERRAEAAEKRHFELMTKTLEKKDPNPLEFIKEIGGVVGAFRELAGGEGGGNSNLNWWQQLFVDAGPDVLRNLAPGLGAVLNGFRMPGQAMQGAPGQAGAPGVVSHTPQIAPGASTGQEQPNQPTDPHIPAYQTLLMNLETVLGFINQNRSGSDFAGWLADGQGDLPIETLKSAGRERLIGALKTIPQVWARVAPIEGRLAVFLDEVMGWPENGDPAPDEDDEPEPPARKRAKKGVQ